jgi:cob(I)alamin adenosyltransferase
MEITKKDNFGLGQVHIYFGDGKGKTTAALGSALRALGNNFSVHLVQFMKNGASSLQQQIPGEIKSLIKFDKFSCKRFGLGDWYIKGKNDKEHRDKAQEALSYLKQSLNQDYDIIIADEILYAVQLGLLKEQQVIDLIKNKPKNKELILTGSHQPFPDIFQYADLVTEIKKIKHPYDTGVQARKGIEY